MGPVVVALLFVAFLPPIFMRQLLASELVTSLFVAFLPPISVQRILASVLVGPGLVAPLPLDLLRPFRLPVAPGRPLELAIEAILPWALDLSFVQVLLLAVRFRLGDPFVLAISLDLSLPCLLHLPLQRRAMATSPEVEVGEAIAEIEQIERGGVVVGAGGEREAVEVVRRGEEVQIVGEMVEGMGGVMWREREGRRSQSQLAVMVGGRGEVAGGKRGKVEERVERVEAVVVEAHLAIREGKS